MKTRISYLSPQTQVIEGIEPFFALLHPDKDIQIFFVEEHDDGSSYDISYKVDGSIETVQITKKNNQYVEAVAVNSLDFEVESSEEDEHSLLFEYDQEDVKEQIIKPTHSDSRKSHDSKLIELSLVSEGFDEHTPSASSRNRGVSKDMKREKHKVKKVKQVKIEPADSSDLILLEDDVRELSQQAAKPSLFDRFVDEVGKIGEVGGGLLGFGIGVAAAGVIAAVTIATGGGFALAIATSLFATFACTATGVGFGGMMESENKRIKRWYLC
jgi:hypothetical protein